MIAGALDLAAGVARLMPRSMRARMYRLGPLTRALRGVLTRLAPEGMTEVEVAAGPLRGWKFVLDLKQEKDLWLGNYELDLLELSARWIRPGAVVYDIGAHIGYHSAHFAACVGQSGKVYAFEPHPDNLDRLRHHLALNGVAARVEVVACAVGERNGRGDFLLHESPGMGKMEGSLGRQLAKADRLEVQLVSLDQFASEPTHRQPDLIKLDVEGGELAALRGMRHLLEQSKPLLLLELHGNEAAEGAMKLLQEMGYSLRSLGEQGEFTPLSHATEASYAFASTNSTGGQ